MSLGLLTRFGMTRRPSLPPPTPAVVGSSVASSAALTNVTLDVPAGVEEGDLLVAFLVLRAHSVSSLPDGWTLLAGAPGGTTRSYIATKVAGADEPANYTFPTPFSWRAAAMVVVRGVTAVDVYDLAENYGSTNLASPSVGATVTPGILLGLFGACGSLEGNYVAPTGMMEIEKVNHSQVNLLVAAEAFDAAGATGTRTPGMTFATYWRDAWAVVV